MKVLVTGVGGGVGQSIVKSLQGSNYTIVGVDADTLGAGLYAVPKAYKVPYAAEPSYVDMLLKICEQERCKLLFPGMDAELIPLSREAPRFREVGVTPVVSSEEVVAIADDKLATSRFLSENGFDAPVTESLSSAELGGVPFPMVLKPRWGGARSRGLGVARNQEELARAISTVDPARYVAQEEIQGDEYTCGTITFGGQCYGTIVMRRILRDGDTYKAFVESNPKIHQVVKMVAQELRPFGACNFQLRMRGDAPYIFEVNARCSGTTRCRALAGFNEPLMIADYLTRGARPEYEIKEVSVLRYWQELVVDNARVSAVERCGSLDGDGSTL